MDAAINLSDPLSQRIESLTPSELAELLRRQDDGDIIGAKEAAAELKVSENALRASAKKWGRATPAGRHRMAIQQETPARVGSRR